ncbi:hypothetical protein [Lipingzhangella rawalii]|uniref:hypothetical protein n=1 Tax=Lipingzhangella rawalii TaxID=2055835 RepID=UPI00287B98C5|nr:hypothetical protein [Lipingzhangella rawalii]
MSRVGDGSGARGAGRGEPRRGPVAWLVFLGALAIVLVLAGGCLAVLYGPLLTGAEAID